MILKISHQTYRNLDQLKLATIGHKEVIKGKGTARFQTKNMKLKLNDILYITKFIYKPSNHLKNDW